MTQIDDDRLKRIEDKLDSLATQVSSLSNRVDKEFEDVKKRFDTLENRIFEITMRSMTANSSAFFGVGIAVLSAVIAYVVSVVSRPM